MNIQILKHMNGWDKDRPEIMETISNIGEEQEIEKRDKRERNWQALKGSDLKWKWGSTDATLEGKNWQS